jgi:hypothetical protein
VLRVEFDPLVILGHPNIADFALYASRSTQVPNGVPLGPEEYLWLIGFHQTAGASAALTRKTIDLALAGHPTAMRLCRERILPPCASCESKSSCR